MGGRLQSQMQGRGEGSCSAEREGSMVGVAGVETGGEGLRRKGRLWLRNFAERVETSSWNSC